MRYKQLASEFINTIKTIAEKQKHLDNLESYLSNHFSEWLEKYANTPEGITSELKEFSNMIL